MVKTPGFVLPSSFSSMAELEQDVQRRSKESGFSTFDPADFLSKVDVFHVDDATEEFLAHYGVKGMRWGKSKTKLITESRSFTLKNGSKLELEGDKTGLPARVLATMIPALRRRINASDNFTLRNASGEKVGNLFLYKKAADELNVAWVEVDKKSRGQGIASGAIDAAIEMAQQKGLKKVTLEVPGNSPDARHIYEKAGFKVMKEPSKIEAMADSVWGGLTEMQLDL